MESHIKPIREIHPRVRQIEDVSATLFGESGYYGTSLRDIAERVGISKAGLLHYVTSKDNLLCMVLNDCYDQPTRVNMAVRELLQYDGPVPADKRLRIPSYFRELATVNEQRPQLVRLFTTMNAEALNPDHPAYEYFRERDAALTEVAYADIWYAPDGVTTPEVMMTAYRAMDGIQISWLRNPEHTLLERWDAVERSLFPASIWEGYM